MNKTTAVTTRVLTCALTCLGMASGARAQGISQGNHQGKSFAVQGTVADHSGSSVAGAHVSLFNRVGLLSARTTDQSGGFAFMSGEDATRLVVTASGFATEIVSLPAAGTLRIVLRIAPVQDSVGVIGTTIDVPASEQASTVSIVSGDEIRRRNENEAADYLRLLPGFTIAQTGGRGGVTSAFIRGGESTYSLVTIDGIPVNSFTYGGGFDFSQITTDFLERIEVVEGAQSALYGSYANSGVVNFVTRSGQNSGTALDLIADGGSHGERRFGASGSANITGWGLAASASRVDTDSDGNVPNSDWRNEDAMLHVDRTSQRQSFSAFGNFDSNEVGTPGPYGSDPLGLYTGVDTISRGKVNASDYGFHYEGDVTDRFRAELFGGFFLSNNFFASPYGDSFDKDIRGQAEARVVAGVTRNWTMSTGFTWAREEVRNSYITDTDFSTFPLRRDEQGIYWENRFQFGKLFVQAGVRGDIFETHQIAADLTGYPAHDTFPADTYSRVDPKLALAYQAASGTRVHASAGTGIRPPGAFDLAFTTNPNLKPERTVSVDAGIAQTLLGGKIVLDGTFFYTRFSDLIVTLGGSLAELSSFTSDNLANAKSQGAQATVQYRPTRWLDFSGNYMYLDTEVLALDRSTLAANYYQVGQQLTRRPPQSGSFRLAATRGRVTGDLIGYVRGSDLDVEPNYGASAGFYTNPGYANLGLNVNVAIKSGLSGFGTLRNLLNERYEEIFGYPSPRLTFIAGMKWSSHARGL